MEREGALVSPYYKPFMHRSDRGRCGVARSRDYGIAAHTGSLVNRKSPVS